MQNQIAADCITRHPPAVDLTTVPLDELGRDMHAAPGGLSPEEARGHGHCHGPRCHGGLLLSWALLPCGARVSPEPRVHTAADVPQALGGRTHDDISDADAQALATIIAVYGILMPPIGRGWTAAAWAYAFAWFLVNDRARLIVFRIMDRNAGRRA